jgi:hypothetical protein
MMIYASIRKSKPKLRPKKEREEYQAWLDKHKVKKKIKSVDSNFTYSLSTPVGRSTTNHIKSLNTGLAVATAPARKVYTGDKVLGIATLHKSNAVPVFNSADAVDISKMRR